MNPMNNTEVLMTKTLRPSLVPSNILNFYALGHYSFLIWAKVYFNEYTLKILWVV